MSGSEPRFGTDGVRGVANEELSAHLTLKLGLAAAYVLGRHAGLKRVVVGRDTRLSGEMLEAALTAGLTAMGENVLTLGVVPTPAVARATIEAGASAGAVISASHNPYQDNGIKFFGAAGRKLSDDVEAEIETALDAWQTLPLPAADHLGRVVPSGALVDRYVEQVKAAAAVSLRGMKLVLDCANGATYAIAPALFADLGADVIPISVAPDGVNINRGCGSTKPDGLCEAVRREGAHAGLAFDGDGDRVILCDENGAVVDGDRIMTILAIGMKRRSELPGDTVVSTIMSNAGMEVALEREGIRLLRTDVGDRYVAEEMERTGASIGGEQSGHVLLPRLTPTGDGMLTGLRVLAETLAVGKPLSELASRVQSCPQLLRNIRVRDRLGWQSVPEIQAAIEDARQKVGKPVWLSVRASGTEPLVRVMAQDTDAERVHQIVGDLCDLIRTRFGVET